MITNWRVNQFKSIRSPLDLELAPLTVLAGANSSGKSSLIQSILLLSQTCLSKVQTRPLVLNGPLTRLGSFDDVCSFNSGKRLINFGFELEAAQDNQYPGSYRRYSARSFNLAKVRVDLAFGPPAKPKASPTGASVEDIQPRLLSSRLVSSYGDDGHGEKEMSFRASRYYRTREYRRKKEQLVDLAPLADVSLDFVPRFESGRRDPDTGPMIGCHFSHFLPRFTSHKFDPEEQQVQALLGMLLKARTTSAQRRARAGLVRLGGADTLPEAWVPIIRDAFVRMQIDVDWLTNTPTWNDWMQATMEMSPSARRRVTAEMSELQDRLRQALLQGRDAQFQLDFEILPPPLREAADYVDNFLSSRVKYLGPLRDEPRPLYPLPSSTDVLDVGIKGEFTAAVVDASREVSVTHISPDDIAAANFGAEPKREPLLAALATWLRYMGISETVETTDLGNLGHKLRVTTPGVQRAVELTHVGVGVSQVLPIVVSCLLAPPGSTLVFEQPELHLHPKVQTLLADLFLSTSLTGKQCIVETHSEYMINRLRLRTAMSVDETLGDAMKIYFVRGSKEGSTFQAVNVNEYGSIADWPEGFFDESQLDAERLVRAAIEKRKAKRAR